MLKRIFGFGLLAVVLFALLLANFSPAQDSTTKVDSDKELIEKILKRVEERLQSERKMLLEKIAKIVEEELSKVKMSKEEIQKKIKEIDTEMIKLVDKIRKLQSEKAELAKMLKNMDDDNKKEEIKKRIKEVDKKLGSLGNEIAEFEKELKEAEDDDQKEEIRAKIKETKKEVEKLENEKARLEKELKDDVGELTPEKAQKLFDKCYKLHGEKKYEEAIEGFKRVFEKYPDESVGYTSAYNIACGYALLGKKEEALDWLEKSVKHGFDNFDHMEQDPDLDSLREEPRYKKLIENQEEEEEKE